MQRKGNKSPHSDQVSRVEPQQIGEVLTDLLAQRGYVQVSSHEDCREAWRLAVGGLEQFSRATEVKRGILEIVVSNSVIVQELTYRKVELISVMAAALPKHNIKGLRFRVGKIS